MPVQVVQPQAMLVTLPAGHPGGVPLQVAAPTGAIVTVHPPPNSLPGTQIQVNY